MTRTSRGGVTHVPPGTVDQHLGASRLAVGATLAVTDVVEAMQHEIGGGPRALGRPLLGATRLISAPVYADVRMVTRAVGAGIELALAAAALLGGARSHVHRRRESRRNEHRTEAA